MLIKKVNEHRNTTEPCPDCSPKALGRPRAIPLIKGVPIPADVRVLGRGTKPMTYPWRDMEIGDLWEADFGETITRQKVLASLRSFKKENPTFDFGYRLTRESGTSAQGIEVWRLK
jgi:hypothetical protein